MKKTLFLWLMLLFWGMSGFGQNVVEVGSGNSLTDNARIPTNLYYNYSVSQVIYLASEINESGNITAISFYNTYSGLNLDRSVTVYMAETELSSFSSSTAALPASSFTEVFQGIWHVSGQNWSEIVLDTPFPYSGSDNLVIAVVDATGSYDGSGRYWRSTTGTGRALNACQDGSAYNFSGSVSYYTYNYFPDIQMTISTGGTICDNIPAVPTASNLTSDGVTVSWQDVAAGESYEVQYKTSSQSWDDYDVVSTTVTTNSIDLTGLNPATTYNIRVRHLCSDGSASSWRSLTVVTLCAPISLLPYNQDFENYPSSGNPMPYCWERMGSSTTYPYVYSSSYSAHAGNGSLYFYPYGANIAVLPEFADALNTLRMTFWMRPGGTSSSYGTMDVGYLQNPSDTSTFVTVDSFPATSLTSTYSRFVVDFNDVTTFTDSSRLAFRCRVVNGYGWYVDDLVVNYIPDCQEPVFSSLQATQVGSDAIDLVWQDPNNSSWNIYYKEAGSTDDFGTEVSMDTVVTLSSLTPNTRYEIYVTANCASGESDSTRHILVRTSCEPETTLPLFYDFETYIAETLLPDCWQRNTTGSTSPYTTTAYSYNGQRGLYLYTGNNYMAVLPMVDTNLYSLQDLQVRFMARHSTYSSNGVEVGVMTNPSDPASFVSVSGITFAADASASWEEVELNLSSYTGPAGFVAIRSSNSSVYVDDLYLEEIPVCPHVQNITVTSLSGDEATVTWTGFNDNYLVRYREASDSVWNTSDAIVTGTTATLSNLTATTTYRVEIAPDCEDTDESSYRGINFTTTCASFDIPYTLDFETPSDTGCWTVASQGYYYEYDSDYGGYDYYYPALRNYASYAHSGSRYAAFASEQGETMVWAAPKMNANIEELRIQFYVRKESLSSYYEYGQLQVGVMTNPSDASSFVLVDSVEVSTADYALKYVDFDNANITGDSYYIAFRYVGAGSASYSTYIGEMYVDDITIMNVPTCAAPQQLQVNNVSATSADVTWSSEGSDFNLYYKVSGDSLYTQVSGLTDTSYTLSNLAEQTTYTVYVARICEDGNESVSEMVTFTTPCAPVVAPYIENFNASGSKPACWETCSGLASDVFNGTASLTPNTSYWSFSNTNVFGQYHAKINIYGTSVKNWLVTPDIDLSALVNPGLTFDLALTKYNTANPIESMTAQQDDKFMVVISTDHGTTWSTANATVWDNSGNGDHTYNQISNTGEEIAISLSQYAGQTIRIGFYGESTESGGDNDLHIDNVYVGEQAACPTPGQLMVTNITTTTADVAWTENGDATNWVVEYGIDGFTPGTGTSINVSGTPETTITGLSASSIYNVYVTAVCADGENSNAASKPFATACGSITAIPQNWDFESGLTAGTTSYPLPQCWERTNSSYPYASSSSYSSHSGSHILLFSNSTPNSIVALPAIDASALNINDLQVSFYAKLSSSSNDVTLQVGMIDDSLTFSSFTPIETIHLTASYLDVPYEVSLAGYTGSYTRVAFCNVVGSSSYSSTYVDDVMLTILPACSRPSSLTAIPSSSSADLSWTSTGSSFNLYYKAESDTEYVEIANLGDQFYTLDNLEPNTTYSWYVVALCGDTNLQSLASTFTTWCEAITEVPVTWDFESGNIGGTSSYSLPECWTRTNSTYPYVYAYNAYGGSRCLYNYNSGIRTVALKGIDTDVLNIQDLQVAFYGKVSNTSGGSIDVGVMTAPTDASTFTPVATVPMTSNYELYEVALDTYNGNGSFIAFRYTSSDYFYTYLDDVTIDEIPACSRPQLLTAAPSSDEAVLSWVSFATEFTVYYKLHTDSAYTAVTNVTLSSDGTYTLQNLASASPYDWYVEAVCADTTLASTVRTFTTLCSAVVAPFFEDFNAASTRPSCWDTYRGYASEVFNGIPLEPYNSTNWYFNNTNVFGAYHAKINIYGSSIRYWLVTPDIDLGSLSNPALMFDLALTKYNTSSPIESMTEQQDDKFIVAISTDHGNTWTAANAVVWDNTGNGDHVYNQISATGEPVTISLSQFANQTIRIAFYGESTTSGGDNDLHIDNVAVNEMTNCPKPSGVTVSAITSSSTVVAWTENGDATAWNIEYGPVGFAQGSGTTVNVTTNPYTLNGLSDATQYDLYVQAACSPTELSLWTSAVSFHTECNTVSTFPYTEDFEIDLGCWNSEIVSGTRDWEHKTGSNANTGTGYAEFPYSGGVARLISPVFDLSALLNPYITYYHRQPEDEYYDYYDDYTETYQDSLAVYYRTSPTSEWVRINGFNTDFSDYSFDSIVLPNPTATYQIAFVAYADYAYGVQLDDITVNGDEVVVEPCAVPTGLHTTSIENEAVTIAWDANANVNSWNIQFRVAGTATWSTGTSTTNSYTITGLTGLTDYEIQVQADCGDGNTSDWSGSITATTTNVGIESWLENSVTLFPNPAKEVVNVQCTMNDVQGIEVFDVYGKLVGLPQCDSRTTGTRINVAGLADGIYFVRVTTDRGVVTKSFVKR